jgi:transposase
MSCFDVAKMFGISKHSVYEIDKKGIQNEVEKQKEISPEKISIDEISRKKGHRYATIVTAPDEKKVVDVIKGRKTEDLASLYAKKGKEWCENIKHVSMDAWLAFRKATKDYCKNAIIAFDHFHLAQHFSKAIDKLRISEAKKASGKNKEIYKGTRWLLLKRPENLKKDQKKSLETLLELNKSLYTAYILRDEFRQIFSAKTAHARLIRFTNWIKKAQSANISEINVFVKNTIKWQEYIRNALRTKSSNGFAEGINTKIRVIQRMAYGYKDFNYLRLKIIQQFNFRDKNLLFDT